MKKNKKVKNKKIIPIHFFCLTVFLLIFFCVAENAAAIKIVLTKNEALSLETDLFGVDVLIDTEGKEINAIEGALSFPVDSAKLTDVVDENSVMTLWVKKPQIDFGEGSALTFCGAIPGGFSGENGFLFTMILSNVGQNFLVQPKELNAYLNDGMGTETVVADVKYEESFEQAKDEFVNFLSGEENIVQVQNDIKGDFPVDAERPERFTPYLARNPSVLGGNWIVVFRAKDKDSGVDHYRIHESETRYSYKELKNKEASWIRAQSPYLLHDQELRSYIYVVAVDKSGNTRTAVVLPKNLEKKGSGVSGKHQMIPGLFLMLVVIFVVLIVKYTRRRTKNRNQK